MQKAESVSESEIKTEPSASTVSGSNGEMQSPPADLEQVRDQTPREVTQGADSAGSSPGMGQNEVQIILIIHLCLKVSCR